MVHFDCAVPNDLAISKDALLQSIEREVAAELDGTRCKITLDAGFLDSKR